MLLRRDGWHVNVKRVRRLYRLEGLQMWLKPPRRRVARWCVLEAVSPPRSLPCASSACCRAERAVLRKFSGAGAARCLGPG